jgi:hypothetical protein
MRPKINKLEYKTDYIYKVQFSDNKEGEINLQPFLWGEAFEELKDKNLFKQASIDDTSGTISWPNGVDIALETLYSKLSSHSSSIKQNS